MSMSGGNIKSIADVRDRVLRYFDLKPNEIHPHDLQKLREDEWTVERFLIDQGGKEEAAANMLIEALKWKKSFGVNDRSDEWYPIEYYKVGILFPFGRDKNGNQMLFFRVKQHRKDSAMILNSERFIAHQLNKLDEANPRGKWCIIFDMTSAGLASVDMGMCNFLVQCVQTKFPRGCRYTLVYGMPWIMQQFFKLARTWMNPHLRDTTLLASGDEIFNYASADELPKFIGGKNTASIRQIPAGSKSSYDSPQLGLAKSDIDRLLKKVFKNQLAEADVEGFETMKDSDTDSINSAKANEVYEEELRKLQNVKY